MEHHDTGRVDSPILLQESYQHRVGYQDVDFQLNMFDLGVSPPDSRDTPQPCLVVLTRSNDMEVSELSLELAKRDIRLLRINSDDPVARSLLTLTPSGCLSTSREALRPVLVWRRHFSIASRPSIPDLMIDKYVETQLRALADTIEEAALAKFNANARRVGRLRQVFDAEANGMKTPKTILTSKPETLESKDLHGLGGKVVVKPLGDHWVEMSASTKIGALPKTVKIEELKGRREPVPIIVQEYVEHSSEVRAYYIQGSIIAYQVTGKGAARDLWENPDYISVSRVEIDNSTREGIERYVHSVGLDVCAMDFLVSGGEELVFLEANEVFDWKYFEDLSQDWSVSRSLVDLISKEV